MPAAKISTDQRRELEVATLKNIIDKIASGGIPTAREQEILDLAVDRRPPASEAGDAAEPLTNSSETCGDRDLAAISDLSPRWIQKLADDGTIPKITRGVYPFAAAVRALIRYYRDQASGTTEGKSADIARKAKSDANISEIEEAQLRGDLMFKKDAVMLFADARVQIRQLIEASPLPAKAKQKLCADIAKIKLSEGKD